MMRVGPHPTRREMIAGSLATAVATSAFGLAAPACASSGEGIHTLALGDLQITILSGNAEAVASRRRLLDMAATDRLQLAAYHLPFPGLGRVERHDAAFRWLS